MMTDMIQHIVMMVVFCLVQVMVLNRIHVFNCATPLLYVYFAIMFPRNYPRWAILLWCFTLGLIIDTFSNTPGVASASMTLIGALQPMLLELFLPRDADDHLKVSAETMSVGKFAHFSSILTLLFCIVFFALESFSFFDWLYWLQCVAGSTILTVIFIFTLECFRKSK